MTNNPFTYTGREYDAESGLYYYRARYYDPTIGRFLNEDPIGFAGGDMNLYAYVWDNPTNFVDPYGLWGYNWLDLLSPWGGTICATYYLKSNFDKLQRAKNGNLDQYYHCLAFCEIGKKCGMTGLAAGSIGGYAKEAYDCSDNNKSCELSDIGTNAAGVEFSNNPQCCKKSCEDFFVPTLKPYSNAK